MLQNRPDPLVPLEVTATEDAGIAFSTSRFESPTVSMSGSCPLCALTFPAAQIEQHVNQCLDDTGFGGSSPASPRNIPAKRSASEISHNHTEDVRYS